MTRETLESEWRREGEKNREAAQWRENRRGEMKRKRRLRGNGTVGKKKALRE